MSIVFLRALRLSGRSATDLRRFASTTFGKQLMTAAEVAEENSDLYYEIQHLNPHTGEVLDLLIRSAREVKERALDERREPFISLMKEGRRYLGEE